MATTFCSYMLASSTPLLQQQELCELLQTMDAQEREKLGEEGAVVEQGLSRLEEEYSWTNLMIGEGSLLAKAAAGFAGMTYCTNRISSPEKSLWQAMQEVLQDRTGSLMVACTVGACSYLEMSKTCAIYHTKKDLLESGATLADEHRLRLLAKIRIIQSRLASTPGEVEQNQLHCAHDWFAQKAEDFRLAKANKAEVMHIHVKSM